MTHPLDRFVGVSLASKYDLHERLGSDETSAFFLTSYGPRRERAVLKLLPEPAGGGEKLLALWKTMARLSHPNLMALLDFGRVGAPSRPTDGSYLYAVFEYPDDNLAVALKNGSLTEAEGREVLESVSSALRYLHAQGLVHSAVDPGHIVAVGDRIKLACDTIREPGPGATAADDVRSLQALLLERPLRVRETAAAEPPKGTNGSGARVPAPPARAPRSGFPKWAYAALAVPAAAIVLALTHKTAPPRPVPVSRPEPAAATQVVRTAPGAPVAKQDTTPPRTGPVPQANRSAVADAARGNWRVIAYTYAGYRHAENKVKHINDKWPAFHAEVFTPKGPRHPPYLVALGGKMTKSDAERLQRSVRSRGLPRDTYVQNYSN